MRVYYRIGFAAAFGLVFAVGVAFAANIFDITYPIAELGGCESQSACKDYCDKPENADACQAFAEAKGLVKKEERRVVDEQKKGPGGCASKEDCRAYCDDPLHTEECIDFAEREGLMSKDTAGRARAAFKERAELQEGPGGCKNETECRNYCDDDANFDECMKYAEEHELMSKEEIERARKFRDKTGPGGCKGRECKDYCETPGREEECLEFAEKEGLIPKEELERAKKFMSAVKEKPGPGGCKGRECEKYCFDPEHREECFNFAKENNLLDEDELKNIERGRKLEEKVKEAGGPGGCRDEKACMEYCRDPAHVEECLGFASAHGGMDRDGAKQMLEEFVERSSRIEPSQQGFGPPRQGGFGPPPVGAFRRPPGDFGPQQGDLEERFRKFEDFEKLEREFRGENMPFFGPPPEGEFHGDAEDQPGEPSGRGPAVPYRTGPGGCKTPDECFKYCFDHRDECGLKEPPRGDGEFQPQGRPFDRNEGPRPDQLEIKKYFDEKRFPDGQMPPERPNVGPPPPGASLPPEGWRMPPPPQEDGSTFEPLPGNIQPPPEQQFREQYQQQYNQEFQRQFQEQYQQQAPPPPESAPPPSEPSAPPPAALRNVSEAVANVIFAPVRLIESLLR